MNFLDASEKVKNLDTKPTDEQLLQLYGLYKQATCSDCNIGRPSFWNYIAAAKWDAWNALTGMSKTDAETQYINLVTELL